MEEGQGIDKRLEFERVDGTSAGGSGKRMERTTEPRAQGHGGERCLFEKIAAIQRHLLLRLFQLSGRGIEQDYGGVLRWFTKVQHVGERTGNRIERPLPNSLLIQEGVFDEAQH